VPPRWVAPLLFCLLLFVHPAAAQLRPANSGNFATADSAATAYANPAGMTRLDRREIVVDTIAGYSRSQFKTSAATTPAGPNGDQEEDFIAIPSVYFVTPVLDERFRFGLSLNVPTGFGSDYGEDWAGRYIITESSLVYLAVNASASVRVTDWFSLGAGLEVLYTESNTKAKINNSLEGLPDGDVRFDASGVGLGGVVSALFEIDELFDFEPLVGHEMPLRVGLIYRPKTETEIDGVPEMSGLGPLLGAALAANGLLAQKVEIDTNSPQMVGLGLYIEPIERLSFAFDFLWIDMEQFGSVDISISEFSISTQSDYRDTYATTFSVGYAITPEIDLLAGFSYVSAAIADADRSLSLPIDRVYVMGVGAKYRPRDWFELFLAVNYYDTGDSRVDTQPTDRSGRIVGEFDDHFFVGVDMGVTYRF
jgi:long-chain fatty acid transport protein